MAGKRSAVSRVTRRRKRSTPRKNAPLVGNPSAWDDFVEGFVPAAAGYAGTRVVGRVAFKVGKRKSMQVAKHAGPMASVAATAALWAAVHYRPELEKYHTAVIGSALASAQGVLQTYIPTYAWILNDYHMDDPIPPGVAANGSNGAAPPLPEATGAYFDHANEAVGDSGDDLKAVLEDGESTDDLYSGVFAS